MNDLLSLDIIQGFLKNIRLPFALYRVNTNMLLYQCVVMNDSFAQAFGQSLAEVQQQSLDQLIDGFSPDCSVAFISELQLNLPFTFQLHSPLDDIHFRIQVSILAPDTIALQLENITDYVHAIASKNKLEIQFEAVFNNNPALMVLVNSNREVVKLNRNECIDFDLQLGDTIGVTLNCKNTTRFGVPCGHTPNCPTCKLNILYSRILDEQDSATVSDVELVTSNGVFFYEAYSKYLHIENEPLVLISLTDITKHKQLKKNLELQSVQLHRSNQELNELNKKFDRTNKELRINIEELIAVEDKYRRLFENARAALFRTSLDGSTMIVCNSVTATILGYESTQACLSNYCPEKHYAHEIDRKYVREQLMERGEIVNYILQYKTIDDEIVWIDLSAKLDAKKGYIEGAAMNITDLKTAELTLSHHKKELENKNKEYVILNNQLNLERENLTVAKQKAEEGDKLKSAFLSNVSHEIRTPLNGIVGFLGLLSPDLPTEKFDKYKGLINKCSNQLLAIVKNIVNISMVESGQEQVNITQFDCHVLFEQIHHSTGSIINNNKQHIQLDLPSPSFQILSDENKLFQILDNLVSNAIKFTDSGSVQFGYALTGDQVVFYVRDSGKGIAPENHSLIFNRFRQVDSTMNREFGGNGIGLSLVKAYVEMLDGTLWLESELGKGTTFFFTIGGVKYAPKAINQPTMLDSFDLSGHTILVAEDHEQNQILLSTLLAKTKATIVIVDDGLQAVNYIKAGNKVNLVIMDIQMPIMDGYEALNAIKKIDSTLPIVAQTAFGLQSDIEKINRSKFNGHIIKPYKESEFANILSLFFPLNK